MRIAFQERWIHRFSSKWGRDVSQEFGLDTIPVKPDGTKCVGRYVSKVGYELALADNKLGRSECQRHPVAIAYGAAETGAPTSIGPNERGGLWIVGLPDTAKPIRGRAHWVSDADVTARVAATAHLTPSFDDVFGKDLDRVVLG